VVADVERGMLQEEWDRFTCSARLRKWDPQEMK
jgi:hypothetical protein